MMVTESEVSMQNARILVADDDPGMRMFVVETLRDAGYCVDEYDPEDTGSLLPHHAYDAAVLDIVMPGVTGFELRDQILGFSSGTQFVMMTGYPDKEKIEHAVDVGVYSFLTKPFRREQILYALYGALKKKQEYDLLSGSGRIDQKDENLGIIGASAHLAQIRRRILELAPLDLPVLISGESGTGKEVVAQSIHRASRRKDEPFIAVNCGGLTASLIESELFGHGQGAFTGAQRTKHGFFEAADRGTLFLDEIGELPLELQTRFLRVLDKGEYCRVGETQVRRTNVRILSATNRDLLDMVTTGTFRSDLYYRLRGSSFHLLPLRERPDDIMPLVHTFCGQSVSFTQGALAALRAHPWPGNVRELAMICANLKALAGVSARVDEPLVARLLGIQSGFCEASGSADLESYRIAKARTLEHFERDYFARLLESAGGNITRAATLADMDRKNLREKLKSVGLHDTPEA